jgi:general secretion pathway protein D
MSLRFLRLSLAVGLLTVARAQPAPMPLPEPATGPSTGPIPRPSPGNFTGPVPVQQTEVVSQSVIDAHSTAAAVAPGSGELVGPIKLADADIDTVLSALEIYTGRTILRPQALPAATYSLKLNKAVPKAEAVLALETLLSLNGVGVVPLGDKFLKVIALTQVKNEAPEMIEGSTLGLPPSGRIATKLFQFEFLRASEFVPQITPLMSPGIANGIVTLDKANAALITDSISNLQRVESLLHLLDRPMTNGLSPKFYNLQNGAKASDVVSRLRTMFQGPLQNQLGSATTFSADDRTNQIILLADPRQYPLFDELIAKLDVKADPNTRNEVIYLKHATAKDVATLLSSLVSGQNAAQKSADGSTRPGQVQVPTPGGPNSPPVAPPPAAAAVLAGAAEGSTNFSSFVTILADDRSNAVIVSGTFDDIRLIRTLVDKLDIVLAQVRIEVVIAEVTLTDTDKTGISALNLTVGPNSRNGALQITNFSGSVSGWNVSAGVVNPLAFEAALTDSGSRHNVRILSAPTIVTTHNKQGTIAVTQQQPVITGTTATPTTGGTSTGFSTNSSVTYKDIGITLKVTPLIGDDGVIQLQIDQIVDDVISNVTIYNNVQPVIGHREANSSINVSDGQMIVLGGLQRTSHSADHTKMGFLHEIPILSAIFGARTNETDRTELLLFLRPHVMRPEENTADATHKIDELSNKAQIKQFLADPTKESKESPREKLK